MECLTGHDYEAIHTTSGVKWRCKKCKGYIATVWSDGAFPTPSKEHECKGLATKHSI